MLLVSKIVFSIFLSVQKSVNVPVDKKEECAIIVKDKMENVFKLSIDLKAPPQFSKNFKDGH